jgi:hypothetical protein
VLSGSALLPLVTALVAAGLAARVGGAAVRRFTPSKPLWALGLLLFAIAAGAEAYGTADGWGPASFRFYYIAGGCLCVAVLGTGSAWLVLPRAGSLVLTGMLVTAVAGATLSVLLADLDPAGLAAASGGEPPANGTLLGHAFLWAIAMNSVGAVLMLGGSVVSIVRRRRVRANVLIVGGILAVSASGALTRLGAYGYVYVGQIAALVLLAAGFELAERRAGAAPGPRRPRWGLGVSGARSGPPAS